MMNAIRWIKQFCYIWRVISSILLAYLLGLRLFFPPNDCCF